MLVQSSLYEFKAHYVVLNLRCVSSNTGKSLKALCVTNILKLSEVILLLGKYIGGIGRRKIGVSTSVLYKA